MRVDMHVHTRGSFDCLTEPDALVERAIACGLDMVCITDHNEIDVALELHERYPERVIVGEEVKTRERVDIIGLWLTERIPEGTPAGETCERVHEQGGIVYVPHPFAGGKGGGGRLLATIEHMIDSCEGFNARIHEPALNTRAVEWARRRDIAVGAGSDAHTLGELCAAYVDMPAFDGDPVSFLDALRRGTIHGTASPRQVHVASTWAKVRKRLPGAWKRTV
ncbi:PHP domain-containing protein [soil metagenome]